MKQLTEEQKKIVEDNLNLVHYTLHNKFMMPKGAEYEDYFQVGCLALCKAILNYDPERTKLSTYGVAMIYYEMMRYKRDYGTHATQVRIPRRVRDKQYQKIKEALANGEDPGEVMDDVEICFISLDSPISTGSSRDAQETCYKDLIEDRLSKFEYDSDLDAEYIYNAIDELVNSPKYIKYKYLLEEYVYSNIYGEKLGQEYLALKYKMSQAQVSRILRGFKTDLLEIVDSNR